MAIKELYEKGIRCREICVHCKETVECYQYKMDEKSKHTKKLKYKKVNDY